MLLRFQDDSRARRAPLELHNCASFNGGKSQERARGVVPTAEEDVVILP